jgi:peptide deformylase
MSELVINTENSVIQKVNDEVVPFVLVKDDDSILHNQIPEYIVESLPNPIMSKLIARLKMTMQINGGIGLSANQCGVNERVFIIGNEFFQMACINPKIINFSGNDKRKREGCLSYPGLYLNIPRHDSVEVEYYTESGEKKTHTFDGLTAQIFQHEMEHMEGKTFTAHVGPFALKLARERQTKLFKKIAKRVRKS